MTTLAQVRSGLADKMATITGLRTFPYMHPRPPAPAVCVGGPKEGSNYSTTFDGQWTVLFDVWVFADPADLYRAQAWLDAYLDNTGTKSVRAAVEADPSLGGLSASCRVVGIAQAPRLVDTAGAQLLGAALGLECYVS